MRTLLLTLILTACGGPLGPEPIATMEAPATPQPVVENTRCGALTLRTWNVEQFPHRAQTLSEVADIIRAHPADVIGLQEIRDVESFWELDRRLPEYEGVLAEKGWYTGVALLYRPDKVDLVSAQSLFTDESRAFPRPPLNTTFEVLASGDTINVVVLHLKARGDADSENRRREAVQLLHGWAESTGLDQAPLVVMGDWNDRLLDAPSDNVFSLLLDDPDFQFLTLSTEASGDFSYIDYESMIDHIMVTSTTLDVLEEVSTEVVHLDQTWADYTRDVSDHLPVDTTFLIRH